VVGRLWWVGCGGVNDFGQLVGFYVDAAGNTDGFLATPQR